MSQIPRRAYELDIHIGADDWEGAMAELREVWLHLLDHGKGCNSVSGSPSRNHRIEIHNDPTMTHERYFRELDDYLERTRGAE